MPSKNKTTCLALTTVRPVSKASSSRLFLEVARSMSDGAVHRTVKTYQYPEFTQKRISRSMSMSYLGKFVMNLLCHDTLSESDAKLVDLMVTRFVSGLTSLQKNDFELYLLDASRRRSK